MTTYNFADKELNYHEIETSTIAGETPDMTYV